MSESLDYHVASRASNISYRLACLVGDAIEDGFTTNDLQLWFAEALEALEDES